MRLTTSFSISSSLLLEDNGRIASETSSPESADSCGSFLNVDGVSEDSELLVVASDEDAADILWMS